MEARAAGQREAPGVVMRGDENALGQGRLARSRRVPAAVRTGNQLEDVPAERGLGSRVQQVWPRRRATTANASVASVGTMRGARENSCAMAL